MQNAFDQFRQIVDRCTKFVITTHVNPDPDAIGSEVALARFLSRQGKIVAVLNHSSTPAYCAFLDPQTIITQFDPLQHANMILDADAVIVVDANQPDRIQSLKPYVLSSTATKICIDHHLDRMPFAELDIVDEDSAATGEILYNLFTTLEPGSITPDIATPLYVAIMTDTGSFRFPKTDAALHRIIADLLDRGADPVRSYNQVYEQGTPNRIQLLGQVLATLRTTHDGRVAHVTATREMFLRTGTNEEDIDNFINYTLGIAGVQVGLMFTELSEGVKLSFRSRGEIAINKLAQEFGGNGHKNAAGARIAAGSVEKVLPLVLERVVDYLT
ncbi:MAG TPA: bifunctional oligoribonuclease/PAP phosphatase NrnA [Bacteroidetes bacterium]|nr:bifunctional oligoribonuclease/PAP phosphatase NrnA [Bacteroidota bacterium]